MTRKGITPVVAIVLLLMMTVAAAGAAFTWFSQMQEQVQDRASSELNRQLEVRDLVCDSANDQIEISISNTGSTTIPLSGVSVFVRDSTGHLNTTITDRDWSGNAFGDPGGFGTVTVDVTQGSDATALYAGAFYDIEVDFTNVEGGYTLPAGGCVASSQ